MSDVKNFRAERMKEAMDRAGMSSGQVGIKMNVSGGAVRGWTTGRRGIGLDELIKFAEVVGYPVDYFISPDYELPDDFSLRFELCRLNELVAQLTEKVASQPGFQIASDEEAIAYLKKTHNLSSEAVATIRQAIRTGNK